MLTNNHRRSRRLQHRRKRGLPRWALMLGIVGLPALVISGGGLALSAYLAEEKIDPVTYCYDNNVRHHAAFFVDYSLTHQTSAPQDRDLSVAFDRAYEELPPNGQLAVFTTARGGSGTLARPVLVVCRPARTPLEQETIPAPAKPAPRLARIADEAQAAYKAALAQLLTDAKDPAKVAADSPVLEQLQAISRYYVGTGLDRLHLFTDGIQNTELARFCTVKGHLPPFQVFQQGRAYRLTKPETAFSGVRVTFLLVELMQLPNQYAPYCTNDELRDFWPAYFEAAGAFVESERLRFGASD